MSPLLTSSSLLPSSAGKVGIFAPAGAGKSTTSVLLALGLSIERHEKRAVVFVDPEGVAEFVAPMFDAEGVPLFVVQARSFVEMRDALTEAEDAGACVFVVDHYDGIFRELTEAQKAKLNLQGRKLPYQHREELVRVWDAWTRTFRASPLDTIFNGRLAWEWGDDEDESGDPIKVKLGTKMRGESDAGYEPNLLIELEAIQDFSKRHKKTKSKAGTITHYAHVLKDRRMILNGLSFQWKDLNGYKAGDYQAVWKALAPHFGSIPVRVGTPESRRDREGLRNSGELFAAVSGESAYTERARRITVAVEEIQAALNTIWPGQTADEKRMRHIVMETLFKSRSWTAIEAMTPEAVESGWVTMQHFEADAGGINVKSEAEVIALIQSCKDLEKAMVL